MGKSRALSIVVATAAATLVTGLTSAPAGAASTYDPAPAKSGAAWLVRPGHRRPRPQRAVRLRRRRPLHRRRPRPRRRRQEADRRQGDHQGGRQERRLLHRVRAQRVRRPHGQGRRPRALAGQEPARLRRRRPGHAARGPRGDRRADHRPHRGRLRPDRRVRRRLRQRHRPGVRRPGAQPGGQRQGRRRRRRSCSQQQCDKGYFRQYFTADKTRADQSCQGAPRAERGASTDATALAVLALQDVKGSKAKAAVKKAVAWLERHPAAQRCVHRHRQGHGRRQHQQHRPGRLGARRDRRHGRRPSRRPSRCAPSRSVRQPVRRQAGQARRRDRLRPRRADAPAGARASPRRRATSGVGRRPRPCRCCAGRRAPRATSPSTAPRTVCRRTSVDDPADRRRPPGERVCVTRGGRGLRVRGPAATPITR